MYVIDEKREKREIQEKYKELIAACRALKPLTPDEEANILRAFQIANKAHAGTRRKSGEPYIFHPLAVALIAVKEVGLGPIAVISALLHDVVEDTEITLDELRMVFGDRVARIVDGVTKIEDVMLLQQSESKQAENYRKILLSMCNDAYVIFLKLCDRLHNMRTLDSMKETKKFIIASETSYLYIPLAHRLGLYTIKTELEELVMRYTNPEKYAEIAAKIAETAGTEEKLKECLTKPVRQMLEEAGYNYTIKTRANVGADYNTPETYLYSRFRILEATKNLHVYVRTFSSTNPTVFRVTAVPLSTCVAKALTPVANTANTAAAVADGNGCWQFLHEAGSGDPSEYARFDYDLSEYVGQDVVIAIGVYKGATSDGEQKLCIREIDFD